MSTTKSKAGEKSKGAKSTDQAPGKIVSKTKTPLPRKKSAKRTTLEKAVARVDIDKLGSLPHSYGTNSIFLAAQDPRWLFTYWDIDISRHPGGPCHLRVLDENGAIDQEITVPFEARNWYVPVKEAGKKYGVELGFYRGKSWKSLARSAVVATPRDRISDSDCFDYATVPIHIGFQRLVETITNSMSIEQNLVPALAELQRSVSHGGSSAYPLEANEHAILSTILGSEFLAELSSASWSSEELHSAIHRRLQERLGSGELGELLARLQLGQFESSLFSMFSTLGAERVSGSGSLSSAGLAERVAMGLSSWLSSWSAGAPGGLAALSSGALSSGASAGISFGGLSSGGVTSWSGGAAETGASQLSSWSGLGISFAETLASWNQLSSWLTAIGSSWSGINLSSFEQAALSSWASSAMSSWESGPSSSWGAWENSFGLATREPALKLSAEITVRGHTDPQNRVVVDGQPVEIRGDGSFEHKLVVSGSGRAVPIEAMGPDGRLAQRSSILLQPATS
ncbi:MAG: DUF4912 domain-containing protein [Terrimicrobiaceae bacterium]